MFETLNPRLDVVFKLLFAAERNRPLLVALLNDVLQPASAIAAVDVMNPEIEKDAPDDRGVVLDILVAHDDGTRSNIEMQAQDRGATAKRALYHWARVYRDGISRGDDFKDLLRCRVVFFLDYALLPGHRLHSTFRALEVHDGTLLSDVFEVHTVELPKLAGVVDEEDTGVQAWAQFLAADTDEERRRVAMANPIINEANDALEDLSRDPKARALARWREDQLKLYRVEVATVERRALQEGRKQGREEGRKEGREEGRKEGREEGVREEREKALRTICAAFQVGLSDDREQAIQKADLDELEQLRDRILRRRGWPD